MGRRKKKAYTVEGVTIVDTSTKGRGIGKKDGQVYFVDKTVPGDVVDVLVLGKEKKVPKGRVQRMVEPSPDRIEARCAHFGDCGGCKWQSLGYDKQLYYKEKTVRDAVERIAKLEYAEFRPILGCASPFNYRNKVEFTFSNKRWVPAEVLATDEKVEWKHALGYHVAGAFDKVLQIDTCHLHWPVINDIRNAVHDFAVAQQWPFYDIRNHEGYLRNIVFRTSEATRELMVLLIVAEDLPERENALFEHLADQFSEITSFLSIHSTKLNSSYSDLQARTWRGPDFITEHLGPWKYRISPTSFFQTNSLQAKVLYDQVREFAGTEKLGTVYDLYCGAGSIGIYVNELAEKVVGIEYVDAAVEDAHANCQLNGLEHLEFFAGDMKKMLTDEWTAQHGKPDLVITDPPRAGMDEAVVRQLLKLEAPRIIYVSCNPGTQARDLALLAEKYELREIQPVDMFPQTTHVENVVHLILKSDENPTP